jgi:hypothetical protein
MDQTLAWIATSFDATAHDNTLRRRAERLRELQSRQPEPARKTVIVVDGLPYRWSDRP